MLDHAAFLNAPVVSPADDPPIDHEDAANGDASLTQAYLCFLERGFQIFIHLNTLLKIL
jgi:hypothetical protein